MIDAVLIGLTLGALVLIVIALLFDESGRHW